MKLYGISGLGADERIFKFLRLDCELIPIHWIKPHAGETIIEYSTRLSYLVDKTEEFGILGVSFGGLVATELSKILKPKLTILISAAETQKEFSPLIRFLGKSYFTNLIPARFFFSPRKIFQILMGTKERETLNRIIDKTDVNIARWAFNEIANWNNTVKLENVLKIHGSRDKLIPAKRIENAILVNGGGHFIIVDKADEISEIINNKLLN